MGRLSDLLGQPDLNVEMALFLYGELLTIFNFLVVPNKLNSDVPYTDGIFHLSTLVERLWW